MKEYGTSKEELHILVLSSGKSGVEVYESYLEAQENGSVYFEWCSNDET